MRAWLLIAGGILLVGLAVQLIYFSYFHERIGPVSDGSVPLYLHIVTFAAAINGMIALYRGGYLLMQKRKAK